MNTLRPCHKLRLNIWTRDEEVLCRGEEQRFAVLRFFWKNVDCPACLMLREAEQKKSFFKKLFKR